MRRTDVDVGNTGSNVENVEVFRGGIGETHSHSSAVQITAIQCENGRSDDNNNNVIRGMTLCGDYRVATLHGTIINIHAVLKV